MHNSLVAELRQAGHRNIKALLVESGQIGTALFGGLETPSKFLAPVLETREVAKEIMSRVDAGEGGVIRLPVYADWISLYSVLPASIQVLVRWMSRIDVVMASSNMGLKADTSRRLQNSNDSSAEDDGVVVEKDA